MSASPDALRVEKVARLFPGRRLGAPEFTAVHDLTFHVTDSEFVSIVGPSGCGKSTVLNLVAGLDRPTEGTVSLRGIAVSGPSSNVGFMLQKDMLLPWRTVQQNVEFGLEAGELGKQNGASAPYASLSVAGLRNSPTATPIRYPGDNGSVWL